MANTKNIDDTYQACISLFKKRKFEEIISLCEQLEASGNYNADIIAIHSAALVKTRKPEDAITLLKTMLGYFPNDARLHINLSEASKRPLSYDPESVREFEIAKQLNPELVKKHTERRLISLRLALIVPAIVMIISFTIYSCINNMVFIIIGFAIVGVFIIAFVLREINFLRYPNAVY